MTSPPDTTPTPPHGLAFPPAPDEGLAHPPAREVVLTRSEEQLRVGTEIVVVGRARLRKVVVTEERTITVHPRHRGEHDDPPAATPADSAELSP